MTPDTGIGFADEMRLGLLGQVRRTWGVRGKKVVVPFQLSYKYVYLFLAVDVRRGMVWWTWIESMKADDMVGAIEDMSQETDVRALVWDGASGHKAEQVRDLGIRTVVQPPYSPELNPAERVFEEVRRWGEGKAYDSLEDKMEAVEEYLRWLASDPARVRSLTCWDWIGENIRSIPDHLHTAA